MDTLRQCGEQVFHHLGPICGHRGQRTARHVFFRPRLASGAAGKRVPKHIDRFLSVLVGAFGWNLKVDTETERGLQLAKLPRLLPLKGAT